MGGGAKTARVIFQFMFRFDFQVLIADRLEEAYR
jgi:hypothetical protein